MGFLPWCPDVDIQLWIDLEFICCHDTTAKIAPRWLNGLVIWINVTFFLSVVQSHHSEELVVRRANTDLTESMLFQMDAEYPSRHKCLPILPLIRQLYLAVPGAGRVLFWWYQETAIKPSLDAQGHCHSYVVHICRSKDSVGQFVLSFHPVGSGIELRSSRMKVSTFSCCVLFCLP